MQVDLPKDMKYFFTLLIQKIKINAKNIASTIQLKPRNIGNQSAF